MNGCKSINFDIILNSRLDDSCSVVSTTYSNATSKYYLNLSSIEFETYRSSNSILTICKYDKNYNMLEHTNYRAVDFNIGSNTINLDENYYYKVAYQKYDFGGFKGYQCNVGVGSMSNELAFGSVNFMNTFSVIIPFIIVMISFALAFTLLKKLIFKSNNGKI